MPELMVGEVVVLPPLVKHWIVLVERLVAPTVAAMVALVAVNVVAASALAGGLDLLLTIVTLVALGCWQIMLWLQWSSPSITVTDQRVILQEGVFNRVTKIIPLDQVQDISTSQTLLGSILDYGTVEIDTRSAIEMLPYATSPRLLRDQLFVLSEQLRRSP
jgi:uncharacterized membrane protein YdbT with pleckstrin-like domain